MFLFCCFKLETGWNVWNASFCTCQSKTCCSNAPIKSKVTQQILMIHLLMLNYDLAGMNWTINTNMAQISDLVALCILQHWANWLH